MRPRDCASASVGEGRYYGSSGTTVVCPMECHGKFIAASSTGEDGTVYGLGCSSFGPLPPGVS